MMHKMKFGGGRADAEGRRGGKRARKLGEAETTPVNGREGNSAKNTGMREFREMGEGKS